MENIVTNITLLDCPFCHEIPTLMKEPLWYGKMGYVSDYKFYVKCTNKKCFVQPRTKEYVNCYDLNEKECIKKSVENWNAR